jgi:hypothetical protein
MKEHLTRRDCAADERRENAACVALRKIMRIDWPTRSATQEPRRTKRRKHHRHPLNDAQRTREFTLSKLRPKCAEQYSTGRENAGDGDAKAKQSHVMIRLKG